MDVERMLEERFRWREVPEAPCCQVTVRFLMIPDE